uniref:Replicase n=1 Tax=Coleopteran rhabdo-related virus OKIAV29 TaxID=2746289 RepID=A0A7D7F1W3_9RHAB|nr:RNA-dependent RNA polymerase [Coleopteran rhabdo-related virus OKIAV29]
MTAKCQSTHLANPLLMDKIQKGFDIYHSGRPSKDPTYQFLVKELSALRSLCGISIPDHYQDGSTVLPQINNLRPVCSQLHYETFHRWLISSHLFGSLGLENLDSNLGDNVSIRKKLDTLKAHSDFPELLSIFELRLFFEEGVLLTCKPLDVPVQSDLKKYKSWSSIPNSSSDCPLFLGEIENLSIVLTRNWAYFVVAGQFPLLLLRDHFLMVSDIIQQRFLCLMAAMYAEIFHKENYPSPETLKSVFQWGDSLLIKGGRQAYTLISYLEAIVISTLQKSHEDVLIDNTLFYNFIQSEFEATSSLLTLEETHNCWREIVDILSHQNDNQKMQIFGLYRIWGHPTVSGRSGILKLRKSACCPRVLNNTLIKIIHRQWREYFCTGYYAMNRRWPAITLDPIAKHSYLGKCLEKGIELDLHHKEYRIDDWDHVTFNQTFTIPDKLELAEVIADKALSHNFPELKKFIERSESIGPGYSRSVIIQWLHSEISNPKEFLEKIGREGFGMYENVMGAYPKEKELKLDPRLYGLLTLLKRLYVVITESLLSDCILPVFPEITMTLDLISLTHKIFSRTKNLRKSDNTNNLQTQHKTIVINMDFNKWNSWMRKEETYEIFKDFDCLFGLNNVYTRSHDMFSESYIYLADSTYTPTVQGDGLKVDEGCWDDHLGGIEGLRQKGWTIFTVVILKFVSSLFGVKCSIMGQGDNQVLFCQYPGHLNDEEVRSRHTKFIEGLKETLLLIGPPLKLEETWSSSNFFIYGKYPVLKGIPLTVSLKRLIRASRMTNEDLQTLEATLSSIAANAASATQNDLDPIIPFVVSNFETAGAIDLHINTPFYGPCSIPRSGVIRMKTPSEGRVIETSFKISKYWIESRQSQDYRYLVSIMFAPSILGGYPTLQIGDLMMHGFPDPLTLAIWTIKTTIKHITGTASLQWLVLVLRRLLDPPINSNRNLEMLFSDPVCLNIFKPSSSSDKVKRMVLEYLTNMPNVKNSYFIEFLQLAASSQTDLANLLASMIPLNPLVGHAIMEATLPGRAMKVVSKVTKTSTLIGLALKNRETLNRFLEQELAEDQRAALRNKKPFTRLFYEFERNYLYGLLFNIANDTPITPHEEMCSYILADQLRERSWGSKITGVTVSVPMEMFSISNLSREKCSICILDKFPGAGYVLIKTSDLAAQDPEATRVQLGPFKPYLGGSTATKVKYEAGELKKIAPPLIHNALSLLQMINWSVEKESSLATLILDLYSSFTDYPVDLGIPLSSKEFPAFEHRFKAEGVSSGGSLSISYFHCTHITFITNYFKPNEFLKGESDNFTIFYQGLFSWASMIWSLRVNQHLITDNLTGIHLHWDCQDCMQPVYEGKLNIAADPSSWKNTTLFEPRKDNQYCWVSGSELDTKKRLLHVGQSIYNFIEPQHCTMITHCQACIFWLMSKNPLSSLGQIFDDTKLDMVSLPVNVAMKTNYSEVLTTFSLIRLVQIMSRQILTLDHPDHLSLQRLISSSIVQITSIPFAWFNCLHPLFLNSDSWISFHSKYPGLVPPLGTPPTSASKSVYLVACIKTLSTDWNNLDKLISSLSQLLENPIIKTSWVFFSPWNIWLIRQLLLDIKTRSPNKRTLSLLQTTRRMTNTGTDNLILTNDYHPAELYEQYKAQSDSESIPLTTYSGASFYEYFNSFRQISRIAIIDSSMDMTALFFDKTPLNKTPALSSHRVVMGQSPVDKLLQCPNAVSEIWSMNCKIVAGRSTIKKVQQSFGDINYKNHLFKQILLGTTSHYKLLSVLRWGLDNLLIPSKVDTILCLGDGVAGYTATLGQLFPQAQLFYQSKFDANNLSSSGLDNFIPASLLMIEGLISRVKGITESMEYNSDLTSANWTYPINPIEMLKVQLIVSDAELPYDTSTQLHVQYINNLLDIVKRTSATTIIVKTYLSSPHIVYILLGLFSINFKTVKMVRSFFSTQNNSEIFVIGCHQLKIETDLLRFHETESDIHILNYNLIESNFSKFLKKLSTTSAFSSSCRDFSRPYTSLLTGTLCFPDFKNQVSRICTQYFKLQKVRFPLDQIIEARSQFYLKEFFEAAASVHKFSVLTKKVAGIITQSILVWSLLATPADGQEDYILEFLSKGYIVFYTTLGGSWGVNFLLSKYFRDCYHCRMFKISELLQSKDFKALITKMGQYSNVSFPAIQSLVTTWESPRISYADEIEDWPSQLGKTCYPLAYIPKPSHKGGPIYLTKPTRGIDIASEIIQENVQEISSLSEESHNLESTLLVGSDKASSPILDYIRKQDSSYYQEAGREPKSSQSRRLPLSKEQLLIGCIGSNVMFDREDRS